MATQHELLYLGVIHLMWYSFFWEMIDDMERHFGP